MRNAEAMNWYGFLAYNFVMLLTFVIQNLKSMYCIVVLSWQALFEVNQVTLIQVADYFFNLLHLNDIFLGHIM